MSQQVLHLPQIPPITLDDLSNTTVPSPSTNDVLVWNGTAWINSAPASGVTANHRRASIEFQLGDGITVITTSEREQWIECNFDGTIEGVTLLADVSGSIVVDIWKDTYTNYPPVVGDSICASALPTLSSAQKSQDLTLTGWTTGITRGDVLKIHVNSASLVHSVTLSLRVIKT